MLEMLVTLMLAGADAPVRCGVPAARFCVWIVDDEEAVPASWRTSMRAEMNRIWSRYGVELHWMAKLPAGESTANMIVLLNATRERAPLGRVARVGDFFRRQIVVSDTGIRDLLRAACVDRDHPAWDNIYARVFARVVSHELGHLLLNSVTHSPTGLMRATFVAADVRNSDDERFSLSSDEVARLNERAAASVVARSGPIRPVPIQ